MRFLPFVFTGILGASSLLAQEVADIDRTTQGELNSIKALLSESMKNENATEIHQHFQSAVALLGDQAGLPEAPINIAPSWRVLIRLRTRSWQSRAIR